MNKRLHFVFVTAFLFFILYSFTFSEGFKSDSGSLGLANAVSGIRNPLYGLYNNPAALAGFDTQTEIVTGVQQANIKDYEWSFGLFNSTITKVSFGFYYNILWSRQNDRFNRYFNEGENVPREYLSQEENVFHEGGATYAMIIGEHITLGLRVNEYYGKVHGSEKFFLGFTPGIQGIFDNISIGLYSPDILRVFDNERPWGAVLGLAYKISFFEISGDVRWIDVKEYYAQNMLKPSIGFSGTIKESYRFKIGYQTTFYIKDKMIYDHVLTGGIDFLARLMDIYMGYEFDFSTKEGTACLLFQWH